MSPNRAVNPGFEADGQDVAAPQGWTTVAGPGTAPNAAYVETYRDGHTGPYHATHYRPAAYDVYTYQLLTGLPAGTYTLRAWLRNAGPGPAPGVLLAQGYGGPRRTAGRPAGATDWVRVEIAGLAVTGGQCEIGVYSHAGAGQALYFDNVAFTRQDAPAPGAPVPVALANPGFEADGAAGGAPQGWATRPGPGTDANASGTGFYPGPHAGGFLGHQYRPAAYEVYTYQTVTGLAPGTYRVRAWLRTDEHGSPGGLRVQNYGGPVRDAGLPAAPAAGAGAADQWVPVEIAGIAVTGEQCELGFYSNAAGGQSLFFDDVSMERQADPAAAERVASTWAPAQLQTTTAYLDGLGRPVQTVQHRQSPWGNDLVQPVAYDALGRQPRQYLPYAATGAPDAVGYYANALREQFHFYDPSAPPAAGTAGVARTTAAYGETRFEASPLNRVLQQGAPGEPWALGGGHAAGRAERPNTAADAVARFAAAYGTAAVDAHALAYQGDYPAGELWVVETTDEDQHTTQEFKDEQGQVVAKKVGLAAGQWLTTGYVYDDFERLRAVLPPKATALLAASGQRVTPAVDSLLFYYRYDGRGRPLAKQVPGQAGKPWRCSTNWTGR